MKEIIILINGGFCTMAVPTAGVTEVLGHLEHAMQTRTQFRWNGGLLLGEKIDGYYVRDIVESPAQMSQKMLTILEKQVSKDESGEDWRNPKD